MGDEPQTTISGKVTGLAIFFSSEDWSFVSWAIRTITWSDWSHTGLIFWTDQGGQYFESLGDGLIGPFPYGDLMRWKNESEGNHLEVQDVPAALLQGHDLTALRDAVSGLVGHRSYGFGQMAWMLAWRMFGIEVPRSEEEWVCSEMVARLLEPIVDLRTPGHSFDEVTPISLYERVREIQRMDPARVGVRGLTTDYAALFEKYAGHPGVRGAGR